MEYGKAMNRNEKVNRRNLFRMEMRKFNLGHTEVLGLYKSISRGRYSSHRWRSRPGVQKLLW